MTIKSKTRRLRGAGLTGTLAVAAIAGSAISTGAAATTTIDVKGLPLFDADSVFALASGKPSGMRPFLIEISNFQNGFEYVTSIGSGKKQNGKGAVSALPLDLETYGARGKGGAEVGSGDGFGDGDPSYVGGLSHKLFVGNAAIVGYEYTDMGQTDYGYTTFEIGKGGRLEVVGSVSGVDGQPVVVDVPEPSAWGLMIVGVGLAGAVLRNRRRADAAAG